MDDLERSYLLFFSSGFYFLLPLAYVERVSGMSGHDPELPVVHMAEYMDCGHRMDYLVIVNCEDRRFGIGAERVNGLAVIDSNEIYPVPDAAKSEENRYLDGMAFVNTAEDESGLAFLLNPLLCAPQPVL